MFSLHSIPAKMLNSYRSSRPVILHDIHSLLTSSLVRSAGAIASAGVGDSPIGSDAITSQCTWFYTSILPSTRGWVVCIEQCP